MKRILAVGLTLVISLFALSCQKIVDDTTAAVKDDLTFADSPVWAGSVWSGTSEDWVIYKDVVDGTGSETADVYSAIVLSNKAVSLTFNADKTFTRTATTTFTANAESTFIQDNYYYSTSTTNLTPPALPSDYTTYKSSIGGSVRGLVLGSLDTLGTIAADTDLWDIGTTATTYNGVSVYPVTYTKMTAGTLNGKTDWTSTINGTWEMVQSTTDPLNKTSYLKLTPEKDVQTSYDLSVSPVTTTTSTETFPAGTVWEFYATKAKDASGKDIFYSRWDGANVILN